MPTRSRKTALALVLAGGLALGGAVACSDDDDGTTDVEEEIDQLQTTLTSVADEAEDEIDDAEDDVTTTS